MESIDRLPDPLVQRLKESCTKIGPQFSSQSFRYISADTGGVYQQIPDHSILLSQINKNSKGLGLVYHLLDILSQEFTAEEYKLIAEHIVISDEDILLLV